MSATNFPSAPKNMPVCPSPDKVAIEAKQVVFQNALHKAFDNLFHQIAYGISPNDDKRVQGREGPLPYVWQDKVCEHEHTPPESRKTHPQLYLRYYAGDHTDLLHGEDIDIPLNKAGKPITFTSSTVLSKNSADFRQYVKDKKYLPDGLCLLIFRQKQNWTYSIVITRDNNGPPKSDWD